MAERKLAYIATISKLDKIPDKDRIVYASLRDLGWQVIVDASNHEGDKVVYVEIDSILPVRPEYEFLRKRCFSEKHNGFVISGMKMAGLVSYGLILPVPKEYEDKSDGFDMTEILEIRKKGDDSSDIPQTAPKSWFEKITSRVYWMLGIKRKDALLKGWLPFVSKTDETRIENLSYLFADRYFSLTPIYVTVKCDGQSATFAAHNGYFYMASHNVVCYKAPIAKAIRELNPRKNPAKMDKFKQIASKYDLPHKLSSINGKAGVVIQGELCGPGIQRNPMGLNTIDLFVFNVYYPGDKEQIGRYFSWDMIDAFCKENALNTVPFIEKRLFDWPDKAALKEYAKGVYPNGRYREGVVIRYDSGNNQMPGPLRGMSNMWSLKCINDDYILGKK
jgi:hypothetical protein